METFEWIIAALLGAALLAALSRRIGAPYPSLLAIGGAALAFFPHNPGWTLDPHLALALFVAPVLVDAAYDTSLRDLRANWRPVAGLVIAAVGTTTIAVALTARWLVPDMPWAVAIALGAIVAPPDAVASSAVMRQVKLPHRLLKILEGESLLNDATALIVYRLAVLSIVADGPSPVSYGPIFLLTVAGSLVAGIAVARATQPMLNRIDDVPTLLILQFVTTFGVWIAAERIGLSGILTLVAYAMTVARSGGRSTPARMRVPIFAVWEAIVFVLNAFAFVLIGMQLGPIWQRLHEAGLRREYTLAALAVLGVTIAARFGWVMAYNGWVRLRRARDAARGKTPPRKAPPTVAGGIVISWAGMRGIVTLAAAFAIPQTLADGKPFPYRDLILFCAFVVVFGTLVIQGLTLKPLIRRLGLRDDDPVGREVQLARTQAYQAAIDAIADDESTPARLLRKEYRLAIGLKEDGTPAPAAEVPADGPLRHRAIDAARERTLALRDDETIGDDAFRVVIAELDWAELHADATEEQVSAQR